MKTTSSLVALVTFCLGTAVAARADEAHDAYIDSDKHRYVVGERVVFDLVNASETSLTVEGPLVVRDKETREQVASYDWDGSKTLEPSDRLQWVWDQWKGDCRNDCAHPDIDPPDLVDPGRYEISAQTDQGTLSASFSIGEYFTLGFDGRPATFVAFVLDEATIAEMRDESKSEEKTLIVSGLVQPGRRAYNHPWQFFMPPDTIETGEAFIETCDATPWYVQRHRQEWAGMRWCPWSSFVARQGR